MDLALLNYLQSQQMGINNPQIQPQRVIYPNPQDIQPQQGVGQSLSNPFNVGISNAIESARQSLGMTQKQQDKALRSSLLAFANNMSAQPRQRGFFNNFASIGRAMSPAIATYDQEEEAALGQNNALANQILKYQQEEQDRQAAEEQRDWQRRLAEAQFEETKRVHNLMDNFRSKSLAKKEHATASKNDHGKSANLDKTFNYVLSEIDKLGDQAQRGRLATVADKFVPGGILPTEEQAQLLALEKALKGILFNAWGYRAQSEFKELPSINLRNSPEVNKGIIIQLRNITKAKLGEAIPEDIVKGATPNKPKVKKGIIEQLRNIIKAKSGEAIPEDIVKGTTDNKSPIIQNANGQIEALEKHVGGEMPASALSTPETVIMQDAKGQRFKIPQKDVKAAETDPEHPLTRVE